MRKTQMTPAQAYELQNPDHRELPNYDSVSQNKAGMLLHRLDPWQWEPRNKKALDLIDSLKARFDELQLQIEGDTNNGHLLNGLISEQQQILQELEAFAVKCLKQQAKEDNAAKKKNTL